MNILRAQHLGFCFGVRDAIQRAQALARQSPLTILGELVHNPQVLAELHEHGVRMESSPSEVQTRDVLITAHGTSRRRLAELRRLGLRVDEATCPLVRRAHEALAGLVGAGFYPVIIGRHDHVEVRGMTGDLDRFSVVLTEEEIDGLPREPRYGVVAQTTQPLERVVRLVGRLRARFGEAEVRFIDTVCGPTKDRQRAAVLLAQQSDIVVVVGGATSNNTRELARTCQRYCRAVRCVESWTDLEPSWFIGVQTVGITAGTSTPDAAIDEVERRLRAFAASGIPVRAGRHASALA